MKAFFYILICICCIIIVACDILAINLNPILSVIIIVACYILAKYQHLFEDNASEKQSKDEFKNTKEEKDKIFVDNALIIMAKVMAADRTNMVCELDIIKQFIKKYDEANFKERVKFVKEYK